MTDRRKEKPIRPATGIKINQRKPTPKPKSPAAPKQVIPDVRPDPTEEIAPPTEDAARTLGQLNRAKENLLASMKEFGALLKDSKLPENRSEEDKRREQAAVIGLMQAAGQVEALSPTEGVLAVATYAVRQALSLRDAGNRLAYDVYKLEKRIEELEKQSEEG